MNIKHTQGRPVIVVCSNCKQEKTVIARKPVRRLTCRHCGWLLKEK